MLLAIDCCIRGDDSATRKYYQAYLRLQGEKDVQVLELSKLALTPLNYQTLKQRDALSSQGDFSHDMFRLARQFRDADTILIAAPFWDLSFPSLLKIYLEQVSVNGLTFAYTADGRCVGCCKAQRLLYFSTCGGFVGQRHLGFEYVKELAAMLGIPESVSYTIEGLDIDPAQRERLLEQAIEQLGRENG